MGGWRDVGTAGDKTKGRGTKGRRDATVGRRDVPQQCGEQASQWHNNPCHRDRDSLASLCISVSYTF